MKEDNFSSINIYSGTIKDLNKLLIINKKVTYKSRHLSRLQIFITIPSVQKPTDLQPY